MKEVFLDENGKFRKNYLHHWKAEEKYVENAYQTIFLSTSKYHKHELEIARFGVRAPRAGTVDVKRLIYEMICVSYFKSSPLFKKWRRKSEIKIKCL